MYCIGPYRIDSRVILAPMAGVTDQPFRQLCRRLGAGLAVSEMVTADKRLWNSRKSQYRLNHEGEPAPRIVQIAGGDPEMLAEAAMLNVERGAQIVDINMGCPAKKVCNKAAGSALLRDEALVETILNRVVSSVDVPVTLKIRTGWDMDQRNGLTIAGIAEQAGIQALAVHGRTRACGYRGSAEYDTIARIKRAISIPVFANGDIDSPQKAKQVLESTGVDAVMIGRAAQGRPWIFREIEHYLNNGELLPAPKAEEVEAILIEHLQALYGFYGDYLGVRIARKHVGWYLAGVSRDKDSNSHFGDFRKLFNSLDTAEQQLPAINKFFSSLQYDSKAA
ncbi:MAG: tRNA dihydrouridine synthase DusB [Motiliproteus sp.]|nr:tRNA dihydrouridine synthase DusB [Motiliproteus sp.]MCW9053866.1 tRNA dihydrouridine synthase DusB [Motiliproteus sp.]